MRGSVDRQAISRTHASADFRKCSASAAEIRWQPVVARAVWQDHSLSSAPTTPPRPFDVTTAFPLLARLARTATRLHPRPGTPSPQDSSIGGTLLWPADPARAYNDGLAEGYAAEKETSLIDAYYWRPAMLELAWARTCVSLTLRTHCCSPTTPSTMSSPPWCCTTCRTGGPTPRKQVCRARNGSGLLVETRRRRDQLKRRHFVGVSGCGGAKLEGAVGVEQDPHMRIGVVEKPHAQTRSAVDPVMLPRPPHSIQSRDGLSVGPPLRTPHSTALPDFSPIQKTEIVLNEFNDGSVHRRKVAGVHRTLNILGRKRLGALGPDRLRSPIPTRTVALTSRASATPGIDSLLPPPAF